MTKWIFLLITLFCTNAISNAAIQPNYRDIKLPTQQMIELQTVVAPAAASATVMKALTATSNSVTTNISTFLAQPDVARNIVLTTGGTTASCGPVTAVVTGTNILGASISENFTITSAQNGATTGAKAFASVSNVALPAMQSTGCTVSVGVGTKLGMKRCMASAAYFNHAAIGGVKEATAPTVVASASAVESNTATLSTTLNGTDVLLFFMQNFQCLP